MYVVHQELVQTKPGITKDDHSDNNNQQNRRIRLLLSIFLREYERKGGTDIRQRLFIDEVTFGRLKQPMCLGSQ